MIIEELFILRDIDSDTAIVKNVDTESYKDSWYLLDSLLDYAQWQTGHSYEIAWTHGSLEHNDFDARVENNEGHLWDVEID